MTTAPIPREGWVTESTSYSMILVRSVVAYIRDRGPLGRAPILTHIKQQGTGNDVHGASPERDEHDGAERILNLLITDLDDVIDADVTKDVYSVDPDVRSVYAESLDRTFEVPAADALADEAERARQRTQWLAWLRHRPFENEWKTAIREWTPRDIAQMATSLERRGYFGWPVVRDQFGTVIDGHLRLLGFERLGWDPAPFTTTLFFHTDLDRLAWIANAHTRTADKQQTFPGTLFKAIAKMVNAHKPLHAKPLKKWTEIDLILGNDRGPLPPVEPPPLGATVGVERPPAVVAPESAVVECPDPPEPIATAAVTGSESVAAHNLTGRRREILRLLEKGPASPTAIGQRLGLDVGNSVTNRLGELRIDNYADCVPGGNEWWITDLGLAELNRPSRLSPSNSRPGARITGSRGIAATHVVNASRVNAWVTRQEITRSAEPEKVLRRMMWFVHFDDLPYLVIPNTLAEDWTLMTARQLEPVETATLQTAAARSLDDLYEVYEMLWARHKGRP